MKKLTSILLACVMLAVCLMVGCVSIEVPVSGETASEAESEAPDGTDAEDTPQETVEAEPVTLDMKNYLRQLAHDHPDAAPEELCDLMLENPFLMASHGDSEILIPRKKLTFWLCAATLAISLFREANWLILST